METKRGRTMGFLCSIFLELSRTVTGRVGRFTRYVMREESLMAWAAKSDFGFEARRAS